jgi:hypothetical protein
VSVAVADAVPVGVPVGVSVTAGVAVSVTVGSAVSVGVAVAVSTGVFVAVGAAVFVTVGDAVLVLVVVGVWFSQGKVELPVWRKKFPRRTSQEEPGLLGQSCALQNALQRPCAPPVKPSHGAAGSAAAGNGKTLRAAPKSKAINDLGTLCMFPSCWVPSASALFEINCLFGPARKIPGRTGRISGAH